MYGLTSQRGFLTTFATRFETFCWLGSSLKKGNKVVRKSWEIRKFLLHNSRKNQPKKNNTMFCLDPLLIGGKFSNFEEKQPIQKPTGVFVVNVGPWSAVSGYLQAYRLSLLWRCYVWGSPWLRVGGHLGAGWVPNWSSTGSSPPEKIPSINRNWKKKTSSSNFQSHHFSQAFPVQLRFCVPQKNTINIYTSLFWGGGGDQPPQGLNSSEMPKK